VKYKVNHFVEIVKNEAIYIINKKRSGTGQIVELDLIGYDMFKIILSVNSLSQSLEKIFEEYEIESENEVKKDIEDFILQLLDANVITEIGKEKKYLTEIQLVQPNEYVQKMEEIQDIYMKEGKPFKFFLEITYKCNLKCLHCYRQEDVYLDEESEKLICCSQYINKEIIFQTLDEMEAMGVVELYITGGEPFLHPNIFEIIDYASKKNFLLIILTNGHIFSMMKNVEKIEKLDIYDIRISVYGSEESHDYFTRSKGSYKKSMGALQNLNKALGIGTGVFVLTTLNYDDCGSVIKTFEEQGINLTINSTISPTARGDLNPLELRISNNQYSEFVKKHETPIYGSKCSAGISRFRISPSGEVGPCELMDDISFGNIKIKKLSDIINGSLRNNFINEFKKHLKEHKCNSCAKRKMCNFCPGYFELETGIKNTPSEYICSITEIKMKLMER